MGVGNWSGKWVMKDWVLGLFRMGWGIVLFGVVEEGEVGSVVWGGG